MLQGDFNRIGLMSRKRSIIFMNLELIKVYPFTLVLIREEVLIPNPLLLII